MRYLTGNHPLFVDRRDAGRRLAVALERERGAALVVVGLARGGVETAAEIARALDAPLDAVAVRKVGHPLHSEYAIGAVAPGGEAYVRGHDGLTDEDVAAAVAAARARATRLDARIHADAPSLELTGRTVLLVDDGLATGATMIAAARWARSAGAARVVVAVPVAPVESLSRLRREADAVVCLYALERFLAVGLWYGSFEQLSDTDVTRLLAESRRVAVT
jgi:putative phosphoribosyl transferase